MIAILGTLAIIVNDLAAMWIGYQMGKERLPPIKVPEYSEAWTLRSRNTHQRSRRKTEPCPRWLKIVN